MPNNTHTNCMACARALYSHRECGSGMCATCHTKHKPPEAVVRTIDQMAQQHFPTPPPGRYITTVEPTTPTKDTDDQQP